MSNPRNLSSFTLIVTFVCLSLIGVVLVPLLPVKLAPSRTLPGLTVSFSMPGNSSRVIEAEVTSKLEAMMARVKGIRKVNSTSDNGSGITHSLSHASASGVYVARQIAEAI